MTDSTRTHTKIHTGSFRRLGNTAAASAGSIHDDAPAQALGFRGAFVPGSVVGAKALLAATALIGEKWMERGWYDLTFVSPVYEDEEVRELGALASDTAEPSAEVRVETAEARICCAGYAGLGDEIPWDQSEDGSHGAELALPAIPIGFEFGSCDFTITPEDVAPMGAASGDYSSWYRSESPWGGAVVPPEWLHKVALELSRTKRLTVSGIRNPGMWAGHALAIRQPLFMGQRYTMTERVADKGLSGRAVFLTYEFRITNAADTEVALGRHRVKWLAETSVANS